MLSIKLKDGKSAFEPGEQMNVRLSWAFEEIPFELALRLLWYTEGKGTQDIEVVEERLITHHVKGGDEQFSFTAPKFPASTHGRLLSIRWAFEAVAKPMDESAREVITIGRGGEALVLPETPTSGTTGATGFMKRMEKYAERSKNPRP